ncbi:MAG: heavy-metal-associated domain-containing protein [Phycisphaerales bacterium]|nr:heavy-metal-associated domain-containing protein [Phycisphaerales bacterium]
MKDSANTSATLSTSTSNAAATDRSLTIDGMTGDACVAKVKSALNTVDGVVTKAVKVGTADIVADKTGCDAACDCVTRAGFKTRENTHASGSSAAAKPPHMNSGHEAKPAVRTPDAQSTPHVSVPASDGATKATTAASAKF